MDKSSILMDIHSRYKEFINNRLEYIMNYNIENELPNLEGKYKLGYSDNSYDFNYKLKKSIDYEIKGIATYNINKEDISPEEVDEIRLKEQTHDIISSSVFIDIVKQLYLEKKLLEEELTLHIGILETLWYHLGNGYYFDVKDGDWNKLFDYCIDLFYANPPLHSIVGKDLNNLIKATRYLKKLGIKFYIMEGKVILSDESHVLIHSKLEGMIKNIGGVNVLLNIFHIELGPRYNLKLDRYLIHRNKSTMAETRDLIRVPYNYLINICGKFLDNGLSLLTIKGRDNIYKEIVRLSGYYLTSLGVQGFSAFEDAMLDYKSIPQYISDNIVFENLYIPVQYNPDFILEILDNLYRPLFNSSKFKDFTFDEYWKVAFIILKGYTYCSKITLKELISKCKIKRSALSKILIEISQSKDKINKEFNQMLKPTNLFSKPLVLLGKDVYFLVSPYFCGYCFLTIINDILVREKVPALNNKLGEILEGYVKRKLDEKKFKYHSGHYSIKNQRNKGECDIVLETKDKVVFLEVKKRALPDSFELGDDIEVLKSLGEGMVHAQKQILRHRIFLQKNGCIKIHERQDESSPYTMLNWNNRRILSISICLPEYGFLTNKTLSSVFLESLMFATYHAKDPEQEYKLSKVNELRDQMAVLVLELNEDDRQDARSIFFDTLFRSLQQFIYALNISNSVEELIDCLTEEIHIVYGSLDFYTALLESLKLSSRVKRL